MKKAVGPIERVKHKAAAGDGRAIVQETKRGIEKLKTGISGLDELLDGGVPRGRSILIVGTTGTGKTIFLNEFLYRGITTAGENGVFVTLEERPDDIIRNVGGFGWDYAPLIKQNRLAFVDASMSDEILREIGPDYDLSPLVLRINHAVKKVKAKRVCLDSLDALFARFSNKEAIRGILYIIIDELKRLGVTCMITAEKAGSDNTFSRHGLAEFVADAVLDLDIKIGQQQFIRTMYVRKVRGAGYRSGVVEYEISDKGLHIYPKIPIDWRVAKTSFAVRKQFGIRVLDEEMNGGIPQGHMILISGNTGTGKTIFCMHFLKEGIDKGEKTVYVALEEPTEQLIKTALAYGWDFAEYEKRGDLTFICPGLIDIACDKLLYQILNAVSVTDAKRVVIDSMSSLESATMGTEQVRQFLLQLSTALKTRGVTTIASYLVGAMLGASKGQLLTGFETNELRLSSLVDGIIILRYVERGQKIRRLLNILKLRGSNHSKDIFQFTVDTTGIVMGEKYEE